MMVAPAVVVVSSPVDISSSSNQQGKPLVIRQPTQHYPHRPILEAPLAFLPAPCHLEIPPPFKGDCGRPVCDSAAFSTDSDITPPTTPTLTTATTATTTITVATTTTTTTTATTTTTTDNNMKFLSSTNSSSVSSSYTHGESHFPNAHPEPIPYLPNHHHYHHHEEEEEEEREHVHQCEHAHHEEEEEYIIPWQEEMRRVEAARYRRDLIEAKRTRQAAQRKLQQQQQQKQQQQARQWVWVVDEEIEAVQEADVIVPRSKVFSWGGRVKDVWRKVFSGRRRLSEHEMPLKRQETLRKLTIDF